MRVLYRGLGRRYPRAVVLVGLLVAYVVVAGAVSTLFLYEDVSWREFGALLAFEAVLLTFESVAGYRMVSRMVRPADPWLRGDRSPRAAAQAWAALVALPSEWTRRSRVLPIVFNAIPFSIFATWVLDLDWYAAFFVLAGALVTLIYGLFLRFFAGELALRPVVADAARDLGDRTPPGPPGVTLRAKLMLGLPLLNVLTGSLVAGLSQEGDPEIVDLGVDVLLAVLVAFTISLELTWLFAKSILAPIQDLRDATDEVARGNLDVRVPVTSTDEVGILAGSFNRMLEGLRERERLREAFGAYVDTEVAERILRDGPSFEGDEVEVTLLFLDIRDFTAYAERSSAREVVGELNAFYDLVVPILTAHGGHANKFVGDGLLAVFGAPVPASDHADRAVAAGLAICAAVRETYGERLRIGVGINSGPVVAGTVGGGGRLEFTVIGDPVNTACRVEEVTRASGDDLLITEATRCLLTRDHGEWLPRPAAPLKGKTEAVALYAPAGSVPVRTTEQTLPASLP